MIDSGYGLYDFEAFGTLLDEVSSLGELDIHREGRQYVAAIEDRHHHVASAHGTTALVALSLALASARHHWGRA